MTNLTLRRQHEGYDRTGALYWRLWYADGLVITEPAGHASIRTAKAGAARLQIVRFDLDATQPVFEVDLRPEFRPVFYRRRHSDLGLNAIGSALDHVVFGRVRSSDLGPLEGTPVESGVGSQRRQFSGQLWLAQGNHVIDCPASAIDAQMVTLQGVDA